MTDLQAALGSAQMDRSQAIVDERLALAKRYDQALGNLPWLRLPIHLENYEHGYQSYPCLFQSQTITLATIPDVNQKRNAWMDLLNQVGISTRPATHAVHMLSFYRDKYKLKPNDFFNAYIANDCSISLPLFHGMSHEEQDYVISQVLKVKV